MVKLKKHETLRAITVSRNNVGNLFFMWLSKFSKNKNIFGNASCYVMDQKQAIYLRNRLNEFINDQPFAKCKNNQHFETIA